VEVFLGDQALTTSDLKAELADVSPVSPYRYLELAPSGQLRSDVYEARSSAPVCSTSSPGSLHLLVVNHRHRTAGGASSTSLRCPERGRFAM
jgi:hypothetical protein